MYKTRYQAVKARATESCYSTSDIIVKVCGGYVIMTPSEYNTWRKQK